MRVLYSSDEVSAAIAEVLSNPQPGDRRVAMVAFVGGAGETFLPDPKGMEIVCWLQPGATDAPTLDSLKERGARVFKSDRLHMKVYWSSRTGCVITSANASGAALGSGGQREAGVWLPEGSVDIERLWVQANPKPVRNSDLAKLARKAVDVPRAPGMGGPAPTCGFLEWQRRQWQGWKLCSWRDAVKLAAASTSIALKTYNAPEPYNWVDHNAEDAAKAGDWLLMFRLPEIDDIYWLRVNFVVKVPKGDPGFIKGWEHQAVEVRRHGFHAEPFKLDAKFKSVFRSAIREYGKEYGKDAIEQLGTCTPPAKLLTLIANRYGT